ncbi:hypothetical protein AB4K20DRAFT_1899090 [Rhizopus microsporus]
MEHQDNLYTGKCVFIGPGCRDMLYCIRKTSNKAKNKDYLYQYTSKQRAKGDQGKKVHIRDTSTLHLPMMAALCT